MGTHNMQIAFNGCKVHSPLKCSNLITPKPLCKRHPHVKFDPAMSKDEWRAIKSARGIAEALRSLMQDPNSLNSAWNTQAIEELRRIADRTEGKLDVHIAEGAEVKANIAVLTSQSVDPARVAVLEARVGALTRLVWAVGGAAGAALAAVALKYLGV